MRSWLADLFTGAKPKEVPAIPIALSLYSLSNKMGNSLLAVRDINHKYIVVGGEEMDKLRNQIAAYFNENQAGMLSDLKDLMEIESRSKEKKNAKKLCFMLQCSRVTLA